ncbi:hypothetical protein A2U01_0099529, partial [Trifolium medium]|nr:hypothetical protein [Trifolium medium]
MGVAETAMGLGGIDVG